MKNKNYLRLVFVFTIISYTNIGCFDEDDMLPCTPPPGKDCYKTETPYLKKDVKYEFLTPSDARAIHAEPAPCPRCHKQ